MIKPLTFAGIFLIFTHAFAGCSSPAASQTTIILPKDFIGEAFIVIDKESTLPPKGFSEIEIPNDGVLYVKESPFKGEAIMTSRIEFVRGSGASKEVISTFYKSNRKPLSTYSKEELSTIRIMEFGSRSMHQFVTKSGKEVKLNEGYFFFVVDSLKNLEMYDYSIEDKFQ